MSELLVAWWAMTTATLITIGVAMYWLISNRWPMARAALGGCERIIVAGLTLLIVGLLIGSLT